MGSSADQIIAEETAGIIPRFIKNLFHQIKQKEEEDSTTAFKVYVQFLEIYGEDIRDLLDQTKTSKVVIRETRNGEVFITGAKEEMVSSFEQMMKALEDGTRNRTTASTKMNLTSSRSHGNTLFPFQTPLFHTKFPVFLHSNFHGQYGTYCLFRSNERKYD